MGVLDFLNPALDAALGPVISLPPFWAVFIISVSVSFILTWTYKKMTDQNLMKQLKDEMDEMRKQMKELRENPSAALSVQKQMMETNMKYMMHSMKATLITIIPIILIFGWLSAHIAYVPLYPDKEFSVDAQFEESVSGSAALNAQGLELTSGAEQKIVNGKARWGMKGKEGDYILEFRKGDSVATKKIKISREREYEPPFEEVQVHPFKAINVEQEKLVVMNLFGWSLGWFGTYIIFSILSSIILRKAMKVY